MNRILAALAALVWSFQVSAGECKLTPQTVTVTDTYAVTSMPPTDQFFSVEFELFVVQLQPV